MVIFDCNGVLVDSEPIAAAVIAEALGRLGVKATAAGVMRRFHGRRPADIFAAVETAIGRSLPPDFTASVAAETIRRLQAGLRPIPHAAHALTWIRGPKAVASSSPPERMPAFFEPRLYSASIVHKGKPAPDLFRLAAARNHVAAQDCIVVEDSAPGITAAVAAGMKPIGFVGGSPVPGKLASELVAAGAHSIVADMRGLKSAIADLRGW